MTTNIRNYSILKREYIQELIQNNKRNIYKEDVSNLISKIRNQSTQMVKRREVVKGIGIVYSEGKFLSLFDEAYKSFLLGHYQATIALCSITAERICYEYIEKSKIIFNKKLLSAKSRKELINLPYYRLVTILLHEKLINNETKSLLLEINDIRNRYIHPKMSDDAEKDSLITLNKLCQVVEVLLRFHETKDHHSLYRSRVLKLAKGAHEISST